MSPSDPEEGEYIIGRVVEVKDFGANIDLLEFPEHRAFVHISEVASEIKYIRDFIREGQIIVARVTKVKKGSNIVDASVRQVPGHKKQERIRAWMNEQKTSKRTKDSQEDKSLPKEELTLPKEELTLPKEELIDKLIEDLESEDEKVCYSAVEALGETGDERAIIPIINFARRSLGVHGSFFFDTTNSFYKNNFCEKLAFVIRKISDQSASNTDIEEFIDDLYDIWNTIKNWSDDIYIDGSIFDTWPDIDLDSGPHCAIVKIILILEKGNEKRRNIIGDIREIVDGFSRIQTEDQGIIVSTYFATCSIHLLGWMHWIHKELGISLDLISDTKVDFDRLYPLTAGVWEDGTVFWPERNDEFTEEELEKFIDNGELFFVDDEIITAAEDEISELWPE